MALVKGQQYTPAQIFAEDPGWLKTNSPDLYSKFTTQVAQPSQNLQSGAIGIEQQQAQLPGQQASSNVEVQTAPAKIQTLNSDAVVAKNKQQQIDDISSIQKLFDKLKGKDNKVSPDTYNIAKDMASGVGIDSDTFDNKFADNYTNPNNAYYNTPADIAIRKSLPQVANIIKSYSALDKAGPQWDTISNLPLIGPSIKANAMGAEIAHDSALRGTSAELLKIAGAGQGSSIRGSLPELSQVVGNLPLSTDSKDTANEKLSRLDNFLKKTYSISLDDIMK